MSSLQVKKVVAVCFLEAARMTLEHVTAHRLETSQRTNIDGNPITRLYGDVRRLRDYLQRCVSTQHALIEIDLAPGDSALLVAACRRAIDVIDDRLAGDLIISADERRWIEKKRQVLADWCVEIAEKPLLELPLPRAAARTHGFGRALLVRLHEKLFPQTPQRTEFAAPTAGILSAGASPFDDGSVSELPPDDEPPRLPSVTFDLSDDEPPRLPPVTLDLSDDEPPRLPPVTLDLSDDEPPRLPSVTFDLPEGEPPRLPSVAFGLPANEQRLMASQQIRDHRLRSLVALDLLALNRSRDAKDHRIATVLLASILEAAVLDHALSRREQLDLHGTPDLWNPVELLEAIVGEFKARDRTLAYHLFTSRNLLRPALQLVTPVVVTPGSFQHVLEFTQRMLHAMGFATTSLQESEGHRP